MRIDRLGLNLRARTPWEAVDLGFALGRQHARIWAGPWWLCGGLMATLLLALGHVFDLVALAPWVFWWFKPALDRLPLYVLSRTVFGHVPSRGEIYRAALRWGWGPTLPRLLWLRFDPFRGLSMPSDLLEGLPRAERSQRRELLRREGTGQALGLWLLMPLFELVLVASVWSLVALMIPLEWWEARGGDWMQALFGDSAQADGIGLVQAALVCLAILAIEPFYVAAGFGLYLSRRVHLEAWDLELGFKRMAARAQAAGRALGVVLLLALAMGLALPGEAWASGKPGKGAKPQTTEPATGPPPADADLSDEDALAPAWEKPRRPTPPSALSAGFEPESLESTRRLETALREAREDASLGGTETVSQWQLRPDLLPDAEAPRMTSGFDWRRWLGQWVGQGVAIGAKVVLWALVIALLVWLLWRYRDWLPWRREGGVARRAPPALRHRSLTPEDVAAAPELLQRARAAWRRGDTREAFACLYRAGLREVSVRRPRPLPPGTTEGELLRAARALAHAPAATHVQRLVQAWQAVAYAAAQPDEVAFESLIAAWPAAFGEASA
jgi:hypothetical protein